jgi:hypothetical protein
VIHMTSVMDICDNAHALFWGEFGWGKERRVHVLCTRLWRDKKRRVCGLGGDYAATQGMDSPLR